MIRLIAGSLCLLLACVTFSSHADEKPTARKQPQRTQTAAAKPVSAAAEQVALDFVRAQHAELANLLDGLRRSNQTAYQSALRDVSRDVERLNKLAERDSKRHALSLAIWKLDSRIRLQIARLSMSSDAEVESSLRPLMEERQAAKIALLEFEYQRQKERFEKLNEQLSSSRATSGDRVTAELARIQRVIAARTKSRSAATPKSAKSKARNAQGVERPSKANSTAQSRENAAAKKSSDKKSGQKK